MAAVAPASEVPAATVDVDPDTLPIGTRLVQFGAYDDRETAMAEWDNLQARFAALMEGKARVIQAAESGGKTFYRLRATGFEDVADARRFCAALIAENAQCISAQVR
jgi:hypothetical protein